MSCSSTKSISSVTNPADLPPISPQSLSSPNRLQKTSSLSFRKRLVGNFRSGSSGGSHQGDSETSSVTSPLSPFLVQEKETEEQHRALLEKAASERDEKRKKKVSEALQSCQRRFDVALHAIQAEMDETLETSGWTPMEKNMTLAAILFCPLSYFAWWGVGVLFFLGFVLYFYLQGESKQLEAKRASNNVTARLNDLEDGLRRCEIALQHDVEQEEEWAQMVLEESRHWEERQRELHDLRGRLVIKLKTQRTRVQNKFNETTDLARKTFNKIQVRGERAISVGRSGSNNLLRASSADADHHHHGVDVEEDATPAWIDYVQANLPIERLNDETEEEKQFSQVLRVKSQGKWDLLPKDLQLMLLHGYADRKEGQRLKESLETLHFILEWRTHTHCDDLLKTAEPEAESFFRAWGTRRGGEDRYGHILICDRVETIDLPTLFLLEDDFILTMRTKQMEVLRRLKFDISARIQQRVGKHVYVLDLSGLNIRKHFTPRVKNLLQSIFKVGGDAYPDSLWQMWIINTPFVFQLIWKVLSPTVDASTKSKIRMMGGKDKYLPEMAKCGIPLSSIPKEFGGHYESQNFFESLKEIIVKDTTPSGAPVGGEEEEERVV